MSSPPRRNPYQTLRLGARASIEEVIERSKDLAAETMDRDEQTEYRRAAEEIHQHPVRRACNQFWEPPGTCYDDEALERFCKCHKRLPVDRKSLQQRKRRFVEEDCSTARLAFLAVPPLPLPPEPEKIRLTRVPQADPDLPLEPWELFS